MQGFRQVGFDPARCQCVDADLLAGPGNGQRSRQLDNGPFAGTIGGRMSAAKVAQHRGDIQDATLLLLQQWKTGCTHPHGSGQVDIEDLLEAVEREFLAITQDRPSAIDQHIEAIKLSDERPDLLRLLDVQVCKPQCCFCGGIRWQVCFDARGQHLVASLGKSLGNGSTNALGATGDENLLGHDYLSLIFQKHGGWFESSCDSNAPMVAENYSFRVPRVGLQEALEVRFPPLTAAAGGTKIVGVGCRTYVSCVPCG